MHGIDLHWFPKNLRWTERLAALATPGGAVPDDVWNEYISLARNNLSSLETMMLDRRRARSLPMPPPQLLTKPVRLAVLAASTVQHLLPGIRVGGLRRAMWIDTYTPAYGQYAQELINPGSGLQEFAPTTVLFALDAYHLMRDIQPGMTAGDVTKSLDGLLDQLEIQWDTARRKLSASVLQNVPLPVFLPLLGNNEHRLASSRLSALRVLSSMIRARADAAGIDLIALDDRAAMDGLYAWHDPAIWHHAKQEIHPQATPLYGDLVARHLAAAQGQSSKCLVLDLDNTLWGGVIGDDGLAGIKLGQGSAQGEAHLAFQRYARDLGRRGIILAVCSKNEEVNALQPFAAHPEMILTRADIACFVANWTDKATNLREISRQLNIGLDSLVFVDDNPAERAIVRRELPMVNVPELPDDPTGYPACLANAGYFEAAQITLEDGQRTQQYQANVARATARSETTDLDGYLRSLEMQGIWARFDQIGLPRIVQLINKTNQFNLTTTRVTENEIRSLVDDETALTLQIRLIDKFGDNGIIAIASGQFEPNMKDIRLDRWVMSCRVLGRGIEAETLNLITAEATRLGAEALIGEYHPTGKNTMVRDHYERLGFTRINEKANGCTTWRLDLVDYKHIPTCIVSRHASDLSS